MTMATETDEKYVQHIISVSAGHAALRQGKPMHRTDQ